MTPERSIAMLPACLTLALLASPSETTAGPAPSAPRHATPPSAPHPAARPPRPATPTTSPTEPPQTYTPRRPEPVVAGRGAQLQPSACALAGGTTLVSFELLQTANIRRVYVKRRRPGFGWSFGREVPMPKGAYSMQHGSLLCLGEGRVLLYAQAGDLRRRRARIHLYQSQGDSLVFQGGQALSLGLPEGAVLTEPFAAPSDDGRGVLLTVTWRSYGDASGAKRSTQDSQSPGTPSGNQQGNGVPKRADPSPDAPNAPRPGAEPRHVAQSTCYLAQSPDGRRFPSPAVPVAQGESCRTVSLGPGRLILTYQRRASLRAPWQAFYRLATGGGASFGPELRVAKLRESFHPHPSPAPGGGASIYHLAALGDGTALFVTRIHPAGHPTGVKRLTLLDRLRTLTPFALPREGGDLLFFAREVTPLDFDILAGTVSEIEPVKVRP